MKSDGTGKSLALNCLQMECNSPVWVPHANKIVYEHMSVSQDAAVPRFSLWWLDLGTGQTVPVFQDQGFASSAAGFSPDGARLSYISFANNTLQIYSLGNGQGVSIPLGNQSVIPAIWSPSGDSLLFGDQENSNNGVLHLRRYMISSGQTIALDDANDQTDYSAAWSPDSSWIAVDRDVSITDGSKRSNQVWLVKPDGTQAHALLNEAGASYSDLRWSPDGKTLIYSRYSYSNADQNVGRFDIYMLDIFTGQTTLLAPGGDLPSLLP